MKVLPPYSTSIKHHDRFWDEFSEHLEYRDLYPARKISAGPQSAMEHTGRDPLGNLAQYVLMFFDPRDDDALTILAERGGVGPGAIVARLWCTEVTAAAWVIHRATLTSYPSQIGQLIWEANESTDPARISELGQSVYEAVRAKALVRVPVRDQIAALQSDPSAEVVHEIAEEGGPAVQAAALDVPRAWVGLASNKTLEPDLLERLVNEILDRLDDEADDSPTHRALFEVCERDDLPHPLAEKAPESRSCYQPQGRWSSPFSLGGVVGRGGR